MSSDRIYMTQRQVWGLFFILMVISVLVFGAGIYVGTAWVQVQGTQSEPNETP